MQTSKDRHQSDLTFVASEGRILSGKIGEQ
jgi:hypothetical protein